MSATVRIARAQLRDVGRSRWLFAYALLLLAFAGALVAFGGGGRRALGGLVNLVLLVVPLVSVLLGTAYLYDARDFQRLLLAQPVSRDRVLDGQYAGLALPLAAATALGLGTPVLVTVASPAEAFAVLRFLAVVTLLALGFLSLAFLVAAAVRDRAAGMGAALLAWLGLTVVYDALLFFAATSLSGWPLERPALAAVLLNPVDTARVLLLMDLDAAALLGYTGAVFRRFFGGAAGAIVAFGALLAWAAGPYLLARRVFRRRDL
ncbi:MAG: ABC transporter permease subunit [Gemmatimonadota bacterium]|nr:ABC transporter permease subunit [Gemmatimonadota bacterium]